VLTDELKQRSQAAAIEKSVGNVGVVGCGYWGKNLVRNFAQLRALRLICDSDEKSLAAQQSLYPQVEVTGSLNAVLATPDIDAVVLATPAALHYLQVKQALEAGKHVFVEKPLALHHSEGRELVELAEAKGLVLMVGHILEYHPAVALLKDIIQRGELGNVHYMYSNRLNLGKVRQEENILWSFAPHDISVICSLIGDEPIEVNASGGSYLQSGITDVTITNFVFQNGVRAHIFVSWLHPYKEQKLVVVGDRKMAVFDDTAREGKLKIYDKGIEWRAGLPVPRQTAETTLFFEELEPLKLECEHFLKCIREGETPLTGGRSALRVLNVLEGCQISLNRGGAAVKLDEITNGVRQ
jgi:UDP-2-acetamido-3-amino-2,3-dideoxy-glucuronate N-acetyltransferase